MIHYSLYVFWPVLGASDFLGFLLLQVKVASGLGLPSTWKLIVSFMLTIIKPNLFHLLFMELTLDYYICSC